MIDKPAMYTCPITLCQHVVAHKWRQLWAVHLQDAQQQRKQGQIQASMASADALTAQHK
jgi:hypothetical protein